MYIKETVAYPVLYKENTTTLKKEITEKLNHFYHWHII